MSYHFACGDVVDGCPRSFQAESSDDVLDLVAEHARIDHGLTSVSPELAHAVRQAMTYAPA